MGPCGKRATAGTRRPRFASPLCHRHPRQLWAGLFPSLALVSQLQHEGVELAGVLECSLSAEKTLWPSDRAALSLGPSIPELFSRGQASLCPPSQHTSLCCGTPACPQCLLLFSLPLFEGGVSGAPCRVAKREAQGSREKVPLFSGAELPNLQRQTLAVTVAC